jgi:uncharacterized membrane protein
VNKSLAATGDLSAQAMWLAAALAAAALGLLLYELLQTRRTQRGALVVGVSGAAATVALLLAVLRPVAIKSRASLVGPKVVLLADASRSIDLPGLSGTRRATLEQAMAAFEARGGDVRLTELTFGEGPPAPIEQAQGKKGERRALAARPAMRSDLGAALEALARSSDERPQAIVVLSDGRLDRPPELGAGDAVKAALGALDVPVHTLALADEAPKDASIRAVKAAGAAVAHQPFSLRVEVGCDGGLDCGDVPVLARELREQGPPVLLASGTAHVVNGKATIELSMTIDRAGARILEVEIQPPAGDTIPENDKRYVALDVTRDRVRLLHVAGRPTYDVRALRMWLKSDASVDVVAFFILRTLTDEVNASQDELALIPFPVDELFSTHLPSFDAVILQDFDASPYGLTKHLPSLAKYVEKGGGLIMVGGPDAFVGGHYANTEIARVLPVDLDAQAAATDRAFFTPRLTNAGRFAPVLAPLRALIGEELPEMPGTNVVGDVRDSATVLLEHPWRTTKSGAPMPILALGEHGNGRTIALTIDGSHRLLFSAFAANAAGRAHGAFWDAMLGWLMRDPRFEPAVVDVRGGCLAGEPTTLVLRPLPEQKGRAVVKVTRLGTGEPVATLEAALSGDGAPVELAAGTLEAGGYTATVEIGVGASKGPTTKKDFACEKGGDEWADSRPDVARLEAIAAATHGTYALATDAGKIPLPAAKEIAAEREVTALLPPWVWTAIAALALGAHWILRRRAGLA